MVFVKNIKYCEAECGEGIYSFAKELVEYRQNVKLDVIAKFNDVYIEVKQQTTEAEIVEYYRQHL